MNHFYLNEETNTPKAYAQHGSPVLRQPHEAAQGTVSRRKCASASHPLIDQPLVPLFACVGFGVVLAGAYVMRLTFHPHTV